jgi:dihydrofolate reductase
MAKLVASTFVSLDGYMVGDDEDMSWVIESFNAEMGKDIGKSFEDTGAILLGRVTYDIMSSYWPHAIPDGNYDYDNPAAGSEDPVITERMNNLPKIVFSRTLKSPEWNNSRVVSENIAEAVAKLKAEPGKDLMIQGSASIVQTFTNLGMIDEYRLMMHPIVLGSGKPLFANIEDRTSLELVDTKTYKNGVLSLRYQRAQNA